MEKYKSSKHVVAYIDLLGVKKLIGEDKPESLVLALNSIFTNMKKVICGLEDGDQITMKVFSDNIIIARRATDDDENQRLNLNQMIALVEAFQFISLLEYGFLIRGGITIGDLYIDDAFTIGHALVDAYYLEDKIAMYPRVVISDSLASIIQENAHTLVDADGLIFIDFLSMAKDKASADIVLSKYESIIQVGLSSEKDKRVIQKLNWCATYKKTWMQEHSDRFM